MNEVREEGIEKEMLVTFDEIAMITASMARQNPLWADCDLKADKVERKGLGKCLLEPLKRVKGRHVYHCIAEQASALFYALLKDKPFKKHNTRIAVVVLAYVMDRHARPMVLDDDKLFDYVRWMRLAPEGTKEEVINAFGKVLE